MVNSMHRKDLHRSSENLLLPIQHMEESTTMNRKSKLDTHLVFEYVHGDTILGVTAPRSNRFYFVHDPNGSTLQ